MGGLSGSRFGEEQQQTGGLQSFIRSCRRSDHCRMFPPVLLPVGCPRAQRRERCGGGGTAVHGSIQLCVLEEEI
ncbi:hypothetical protein CgunFtcFv8_026237 [Champsocephalus gunnari]|uniref:Uncharacterized protein n=1 Tax=Champsocephalus gunnari TaxID=52237 RepID=A0AAN8H3N2_CHAGU|nr:hypothetical protein CgunFtcFv8_026237 [Champsocephalus gunnari]